MNKFVVILSALIPVLLSVTSQAFADPKHCYSYSECYNIGYGHGYADGQNGYSLACHDHSQAFCDGYHQGYRDAISYNGNNGIQQGQSSQVSIRGSNNDVTVNQQTNNQVGSNDGGSTDVGGSSGHHHSSSFQPVCKFLCSLIKIG